MKIKFTLLALLIFSISGCGYKSIYSANSSNFNIKNIEIIKKNRLNKIIKNRLEAYSDTASNNIIDLKIDSNKEKKITTKDARGNPKIFNMSVSVNIEIIQNQILIDSKKFTQNFSYENSSKKFELGQYEKNIQKNLVDKILESIILYLQTS